MKSIVKFSLAAIGILLLLANCSKPNDSTPNSFTSYIKGKVDGVVFECTTNISATKPFPTGADVYLEINGGWSTGSVYLIINNGTGSAAIAPGAYIFETSKYWRGTITVDGRSYGAGGGYITTPLQGSGKITILEISSEYVKGSFEFTSKPDDVSGVVKTVTNGEFYIKRS